MSVTNLPHIDRLKRQLTGVDLTGVEDETLQELLEASIAWVEDICTTSFDPTVVDPESDPAGDSLYDGNGTAHLTLRKRPILKVNTVMVTLPVLALTRVYTPEEIKVYAKQGQIRVFTYKLMVEYAMLRLDDQIYGNVFPALPQCVHVGYVYGFPLYDPDQEKTSLDGVTWTAGDTRDRELVNWCKNLQQAALCDAAASYLAQVAALGQGLITSVSFDGFTQSMNPTAYGAQVTALVERRDALLKRRRRAFHLTTIGG